MQTQGVRLASSIRWMPTGVLLTACVVIWPTMADAATFVTDRAALNSTDRLDWSSLGQVFNPLAPDFSALLPNSFSATSERGLNIDVAIAPPSQPGISPPFVFQTLPFPQGIPTNFASGDFVLFTGVRFDGSFPAIGNPGPVTLSFDRPVSAAGAQLAVDDTASFTAFIAAFDQNGSLLGQFSTLATASTALDNSAQFLGIRSETANIARLVFSASEPNRALGLNQLSIAAPIPEPATVLGLGLLGGLGLFSRTRSRQIGEVDWRDQE